MAPPQPVRHVRVLVVLAALAGPVCPASPGTDPPRPDTVHSLHPASPGADLPRPDPAHPPTPEVVARYHRLSTEGSAHMVRRDPSRAATLFGKMEALVPSAAEGPYLLSGALAQTGDLDAAVRALARAIRSGFGDARRMQFDPALRPLWNDPRFRDLVEEAEAKARELVEGAVAGPSPRPAPAFQTLEALQQHFSALQRKAESWSSVLSPGEYQRLHWSLLDARRAALERFMREQPAGDPRIEAELELVALLGDYRDPPRADELQRAIRRAEAFVRDHQDHSLASRARWWALHLQRRGLAAVHQPGERQQRSAELLGRFQDFLAEAEERQWDEAGLALIDLMALETARPEGDATIPFRRLREDYRGNPQVWAFAREHEAALMLRLAGIPSFQATDLDGKPAGSEALRGKVVLLDFWATWCLPCVEQIPELARLHRELATDGRLLLLGVSLDTTEEIDEQTFRRWLVENGITWPQVRDGLGERSALPQAFGVEGVPFQVLMGPDGSVLAAGPRVGAHQVHQAIAALSP